MTAITPFRINVSDEAIADLGERLAMTRWPQQVAADWTHGQPVPFIRELAEQWAHFDWRAVEAKLNAYPQFTTEIDGQTIHFLHIRGREPNAFPLILTHGWPSSVAEVLDVIGPLTDPRAHGPIPASPSISSSRRCPASAGRCRCSRAGTRRAPRPPGTR